MAVLTTRKVIKLLNKGYSATEIGEKYAITRQGIYYHINKITKKNRKFKKNLKKKNYNTIIAWKLYNEALVKRGELLLDFKTFENWGEDLKNLNEDKVGRPYLFPDSFIDFLSRLKCIFKIDYRTLEGLARQLVRFIPNCTNAPDFSTINIRFGKLKNILKVYAEEKEQEIAGDSSGLKTSNRGEYKMNKYRGKRKKFIKLHLSVNIKNNQVVSCIVTKEKVRDGEKLKPLIEESARHGKIKKALFDRGYDSNENHWYLKENNIAGAIKPKATMNLKRLKEVIRSEKDNVKNPPDNNSLNNSLKRLNRLYTLKKYLKSNDSWRQSYDYGQRWKVEGRYSVFKRIFDDHVFSKKMKMIKNEVMQKINMMNEFTYYIMKSIYNAA